MLLNPASFSSQDRAWPKTQDKKKQNPKNKQHTHEMGNSRDISSIVADPEVLLEVHGFVGRGELQTHR